VTATAPGIEPLPPGAQPGDLPEDPEDVRVALIQRRRRGRTGLVATSWRGVLTPRPDMVQRKRLLGE
jgi:hypothetical protein